MSNEQTTRPLAPGSTGTPGTAPADSPQLAAEREAALAAEAGDTAATRTLSSEQLFPTCMIVAMFGVLLAFVLPMLCWFFNMGLPHFLSALGR